MDLPGPFHDHFAVSRTAPEAMRPA